uniref:Uncharacterized protein n=1 Tax=Rhizophagus irregularis (strain DAOM 181602 / DAOM 197198 / MUCL 43194) TaxID=747089 RepID=U9U135_RHIID
MCYKHLVLANVLYDTQLCMTMIEILSLEMSHADHFHIKRILCNVNRNTSFCQNLMYHVQDALPLVSDATLADADRGVAPLANAEAEPLANGGVVSSANVQTTVL